MNSTPFNFHPTKYWHKLNDGRIQCDICPQACKLQEKQYGFCHARMRQGNQILLTTYGQVSGFAIDPVEKKPLNHFYPGSLALSFGTTGCNLACKFCQNWDISKDIDHSRLSKFGDPKEIAKRAKETGCKSVAFTYNEPIITLEYAIDTAIECHKLGIKTIAVTNGYICDEPRKEFFAHMDAARVDLKAFTEDFYKTITGSHLQPVLDTLLYIKNYTNVWLEIICLLIPGKNDSEKEIDTETKWIRENLGPNVPVHYNAFFPSWKMLDVPSTPRETLVKAYEIAIKNGIHYVYIGNTSAGDSANTYCYNCKKCLIARNGYVITDYALTQDGKCKFCDTQCEGRF